MMPNLSLSRMFGSAVTGFGSTPCTTAANMTKNPIVLLPSSSKPLPKEVAGICHVGVQGTRKTMEDEACIEMGEDGGIVGVFDGHGGSFVSKYVAKNLPPTISDQDISTASTPDSIADSINESYRKVDEELRSAGRDVTKTGATGVTSYITPSHIITSWVGDSRCVLFSSEKCIPLSSDHKPGQEKEKRRIEEAGGSVIRGRINGELAVARSFGDFFYKEDEVEVEKQMVTCVPDVAITERKKEDNFLVLACDGIWDVITNKDCCLFISDLMSKGRSLDDIAGLLVDYCLLSGSKDNMTVLIVMFEGGRDLKPGCHERDSEWGNVPKFPNSLSRTPARSRSMLKNETLTASSNGGTFTPKKEESESAIVLSLPAATHSDVALGLVRSEVLSWDEEDVVNDFLKPLEWGKYIDTFLEQGVDGQLLLMLSQSECEDDLGMTSRDAHFLLVATRYCNAHIS